MELFKNANFNFLGRKWLFILPSLLLILAGIISLAANGGPRYGIDFLGGAVMEVRWHHTPPPLEKLRSTVSARVPNTSVVGAHSQTGGNEFLITAEAHPGQDLTAIRDSLEQALTASAPGYTVRGFESIGPQIGADLRNQALLATFGATAGMLLYLTWRFRTVYGIAAVIAMAHDTLITLGILSLLRQEITITVVAALLTLVGYSMNDTIVVFDRIRENRRANPRESLAETVNRSINQTLSRTVLTSGLTLLTAIALLLFGGPVLHGFSLVLVIGIIVGTFSSVFIASPILIGWEQRSAFAARRLTLPAGGAQ